MISQVLSTMPQDALWGSYAAPCQPESCLQLLAVCLQRCYKRSDALHMDGIYRDLREHSTRSRQENLHSHTQHSLQRWMPYGGKKICTHAITVAVEEPVCACCLLVCEEKVLERLRPSRALRQAGEHKMWRRWREETLSFQISKSKASNPVCRFRSDWHQACYTLCFKSLYQNNAIYVPHKVNTWLYVDWKRKSKEINFHCQLFLEWLISSLVFKVSMSVFRCLYFIREQNSFLT